MLWRQQWRNSWNTISRKQSKYEACFIWPLHNAPLCTHHITMRLHVHTTPTCAHPQLLFQRRHVQELEDNERRMISEAQHLRDTLRNSVIDKDVICNRIACLLEDCCVWGSGHSVVLCIIICLFNGRSQSPLVWCVNSFAGNSAIPCHSYMY